MYIPPKALSETILPPEKLRPDRICCDHYEDFGLGDAALYIGMFGLNRFGYIPLSAIDRVYKRLAVSKGFFEEGKLFGTLAYLVVCYDGNKQKAYRFTNEENVDALLNAVREKTNVTVGKA